MTTCPHVEHIVISCPLVYAGEGAHQLVECGWASRLEEMRPAQSAAHAMREGVLVAVVFTASHISTPHRSIRVYVGVGFIGVSGSGTSKRANGLALS